MPKKDWLMLFLICLTLTQSASSAQKTTVLARPKQMTSGKNSSISLVNTLKNISERNNIKLIVELYPTVSTSEVPGKTTNADSSLSQVMAKTATHRKETSGIIVLQPDTYPANSPYEKSYRAAIGNVATLLDTLPAKYKQDVKQGVFIDVKSLPLAQQAMVRKSLFQNVPTDQTWRQWKTENVALKFLFDPYIEVLPPANGHSTKFFVETPYLLSDIRHIELDGTSKKR